MAYKPTIVRVQRPIIHKGEQVTVDVYVTADWEKIASGLALKAWKNKSKTSIECGGAVSVEVRRAKVAGR